MSVHSDRRRICVITTVHSPEDARIFHKECRTLSKEGYEVYLIAPAEGDFVVNGIRILSLPFPKDRKDRLLRLGVLAYYRAIETGAKVVHIHDPELMPVGALLKMHGKKVIYDVHEDVPKQVLSKYWVPPALRRPLSYVLDVLEKAFASLFDAVVAAEPGIARRFASHKTVLVQNFPLLDEFDTKNVSAGMSDYRKRPPNVVYVGGLSHARGIYELMQSLERLRVPGAKLLLAGRFFPPSLQDEVSSLPAWRKVEYLGWISRGELVDVLSRARVGVVVLHPTPKYQEALPTKLFEYMAAGIPVVASNFPLWEEIVNEAGAGIVVDPLNPEEIASAISWLLEHPREAEEMGRRGRKAAFDKYNWDRESKKLLDLYGKLMG